MAADRREYLKQYLLACVRDSVLSWSDLASPDVFQKFVKVLSSDVKVVLTDLGKAAGGGLLRAVGGALSGLAEDVVAGRRK